jgi:hypothetical protein
MDNHEVAYLVPIMVYDVFIAPHEKSLHLLITPAPVN